MHIMFTIIYIAMGLCFGALALLALVLIGLLVRGIRGER